MAVNPHAPIKSSLLCTLGLCATMGLQAQSGFQKFISYPGGDSLNGFSITMTPNGGVGWMSGTSGSYMVGIDTNGVPQWAGTFDFDSTGTGLQQGFFVATSDGGAIIHEDFLEGLGGLDILPGIAMARLDNSGQVMWSKRYLFPDTLVAFSHALKCTIHPNSDGTTIAVIGCLVATSVLDKLLVLKVDAAGTPIWATHINTPYSNYPTWHALGTSDGGCMITVGKCQATVDVELMAIRLSGSGAVVYANTYDLSNNSWEVCPSGVLEGPNGQCVIASHRTATMFNYFELMWLDQGGTVYRHRVSSVGVEYAYLGRPKAWQEDVLWIGDHAVDSTGADMLGGLRVVSPGIFGTWSHSLSESSRQWIDSTYWISGKYFAAESVFGYVEERPFLMKVPAWQEFGCRTELIPPASVDFIDVPDSLLVVTPFPQPWWNTQPDVIDTAGTMVPRNPNTVYDFCTLVSVAEEEPQASVSIWPNPVAQGSVLNVATTAAAALTIRDVSGRTVLHLNKTNMQAQVNTTGLAQGHYLITGSDALQGVQWSKTFIVH